jgi:hypothetical protein
MRIASRYRRLSSCENNALLPVATNGHSRFSFFACRIATDEMAFEHTVHYQGTHILSPHDELMRVREFGTRSGA